MNAEVGQGQYRNLLALSTLISVWWGVVLTWLRKLFLNLKPFIELSHHFTSEQVMTVALQ